MDLRLLNKYVICNCDHFNFDTLVWSDELSWSTDNFSGQLVIKCATASGQMSSFLV